MTEYTLERRNRMNDSYTLVYWRLRRIEDTGTSANTMDMPHRFIPALTAGLAYYIAMKKGVDPERVVRGRRGHFYSPEAASVRRRWVMSGRRSELSTRPPREPGAEAPPDKEQYRHPPITRQGVRFHLVRMAS